MSIVGYLYANEQYVKIGALEFVIDSPIWMYNRSGVSIPVYDDYSTIPASGVQAMNPQYIYFLSPNGLREGWIATPYHNAITEYYDNRLGCGNFNGYRYARYEARKSLNVYDRYQNRITTLNAGDQVYARHNGSTDCPTDPFYLPDIIAGTQKRHWMLICGYKKGTTNHTISTGVGWVDPGLGQGSVGYFGLRGRYI